MGLSQMGASTVKVISSAPTPKSLRSRALYPPSFLASSLVMPSCSMGEPDGVWGGGFSREWGLAQLSHELTCPNLNRAGETLGQSHFRFLQAPHSRESVEGRAGIPSGL